MYDLVIINREPIDEHALEGFLLERTRDLILLNVVIPDVVCLNGYCVIRRRDVRRLKVQRKDSFLIRALSLKEISPISPIGISIASWPDLLKSLNERFPLFTIHQEWLDSEVCFVGRLAARSETTFGLKEIDPDARWSRSRSYKFADLTKVDFGGGYEESLARLATAGTRKKKASVKPIKSSRLQSKSVKGRSSSNLRAVPPKANRGSGPSPDGRGACESASKLEWDLIQHA